MEMMFDRLREASREFGDLLSKIYYPIDIVDSDGAPISARFSSRGSGAIRGTRVRLQHGAPVIGQRSLRAIRQGGSDEFLLVGVMSGQVLHQQFGRNTVTGAGRMVLLDSRAPYEFERRFPGEVVSYHLPGPIVREVLRDPKDICAVSFAANAGIGDTVRALCASAWRGMAQLDEAERDLLARTIIGLLASACRSENGSTPQHLARVSPFARAMQFIARSIDDPDLTPAKIADAAGVSVGHLYTVMNKHGKTSGAVVLEMRLARCARDLSAADGGTARVSEVAYRWGFTDPAHFSRSFRKRFGCAPRDYRARMG